MSNEPGPSPPDKLRHWMSLIDEAVRPSRLYHGTTISKMISIFAQDQLKGNNTPHGVSLTRDLRTAIKFSKKFDFGSMSDGAVLEFDRDELARKFGRNLVPIDRAQATPMGSRSESEERLLGNPSDIVQFIIRVIINDTSRFDLSAYPVSTPIPLYAKTCLTKAEYRLVSAHEQAEHFSGV